MIPAELAAHRLAAQFLTTPGPANASDVVRALGAVQAQDDAGAKWALSQRTLRGVTDAEIEHELAAGRTLRTHVLRPTWHFVAPEDIRWMLALTAPRVIQFMSYSNRRLELDATVVRRSNSAIAKALRDRTYLTRTELRSVLKRARIGAITGQRLGHLMMLAELEALVCSGPRMGKHFTYALLDERVPPTTPLERDAALLELTRRYFATRGPATVHDFAWWSGLTVADAKRGAQIAGRELESIEADGKTYWIATSVPRLSKAKRSAHLLPNYDEYFIGLKDRSAIGARLGDVTAVTGGDARIPHVAFVDGQLVGEWKRLVDGPGAERSSVVVELTVRVVLTAAERRRIAAEVRRFGEFLGAPVRLREHAG